MKIMGNDNNIDKRYARGKYRNNKSTPKKVKKPAFIRCKKCGSYFDRQGTATAYCTDFCAEIAHKENIENEIKRRKTLLFKIMSKGCYFSFLGDCVGDFNCRMKDGRSFKDINDLDSTSSIFQLRRDLFDEAILDINLTCLCDRHHGMVVRLDDQGMNWDEVLLYAIDAAMASKGYSK